MKGKLDMVVGGQFGDEGKGSAVQGLMARNDYGFTVRVGGYNAEHRYKANGKEYMCRVLPCGLIQPGTVLCLGAGHVFSIEALNEEVEKFGIDPAMVVIDRNAGIVTEKHLKRSREADRSKRGGTTGRGAGKASADKVLRDGTFKVAKDYVELADKYTVCNVSQYVNDKLMAGSNGLLEGSQGALISLNHGYYPYSCAKDVTPAGVIAEAGVGFRNVDEVVAVYRAFPMRVPGKSGPTGGLEWSWAKVENHLGKELPESAKRQTLHDYTDGDYERIFEWSWKDFGKSVILCDPIVMMLTFADWLNPDDEGKTEWEDLSLATKDHVAQMESSAKQLLGREVPVKYIRTGVKDTDIVVR
ncbi:MAG: adenylosuccinate synthetase [Spirochaetales bacterium]|nr:adenylosuccinate synthetase [Spirochaetales bacterium]